MTKNDYIEKTTKNLEHLTKDELKDVATLTNAQFGVRLKVAEKEYWGKEIANLKSQLQQQALPVVPSFVAEWIEYVKGKDNNVTALLTDFDNMPEDVDEWLFLQSNDDNINLILRAWIDGYTVEKPQLFYLKNKITGMYLSSDGEGLYEQHKNHGFKFTQEDINSLDTGSYEQIEVTE